MAQKFAFFIFILLFFFACKPTADKALISEINQSVNSVKTPDNLDFYSQKINGALGPVRDSLAKDPKNVRFQLMQMPLNDLNDLVKKSAQISTLKASMNQVIADHESGKLKAEDARSRFTMLNNQLTEAQKNYEFLNRLMGEFDKRIGNMFNSKVTLKPIR